MVINKRLYIEVNDEKLQLKTAFIQLRERSVFQKFYHVRISIVSALAQETNFDFACFISEWEIAVRHPTYVSVLILLHF